MAIIVKDEVRKGISYTKREIKDLEELILECDEAIKYMSETYCTKVSNAKRISKIQDEKHKAQRELYAQKLSLKNYAEYYGLKKHEIEAVEPATDEELASDWDKDLKEASKPYNPNDLLELVAKFEAEHPQETETL